MSNERFTVRWQAADGYVGGARPNYVEVSADEFEGMTEVEIQNAVEQIVQEDFEQNVYPAIQNSTQLDAWIAAIAKKDPV